MTIQPSSNKKAAFFIVRLIIGIILSSRVFSLELGDITLLSKLGEPLLAKVNFSHHQSLNEQEIIIRQAPVAVYQQMDVDKGALYQELRFTLTAEGEITITTYKPLKEPYLNFILQLRWPQGEIYREFSVLIDPA